MMSHQNTVLLVILSLNRDFLRFLLGFLPSQGCELEGSGIESRDKHIHTYMHAYIHAYMHAHRCTHTHIPIHSYLSVLVLLLLHCDLLIQVKLLCAIHAFLLCQALLDCLDLGLDLRLYADMHNNVSWR